MSQQQDKKVFLGTVKLSMFNFEKGVLYRATRSKDGWEVFFPEGGGSMIFSEDMFEPSNDPSMGSSGPEQQPNTKKGGKKKSTAGVGVGTSEQERKALNAAKEKGKSGTASSPTGSNKNPVSPEVVGEGIVNMIMNKANGTGGTPTQQGNPPNSPSPFQDGEFEPVNTSNTGQGNNRSYVENMARDRWVSEKRAKLIPPSSPIKPCQFWLSDVTGGKLPKSGVDHLITAFDPYSPDYPFSEEARNDVPDVKEYFAWNPDVLEVIFLAHRHNLKALLSGYSGTGKTSSLQQFCALIYQPYIRLQGKANMDESSFLGFLWASSEGTQFDEGLLPIALREGYVIAIDEIFKITAETQMGFHTVYEEDGHLILYEKPGALSEKVVIPHPMARIVATDNVKGLGDQKVAYAATQIQDTSMLDRFELTIDVDYLAPEVEIRILADLFPTIPYESLDAFVKVANFVRKALKNGDLPLTISMRGLKAMCRLYTSGLPAESAYRIVYVNKLSEDKHVDTAMSFATTVGLSYSFSETKFQEAKW
jgi:cobaltochelatase CobS